MAKITNGNNLTGNANGTLNGKPAEYNNPVIPVGFKTSNEGASWSLSSDGTYVTGWNEGLVIQDGSGNQFVWVPIHNQAVIENGKTIPAVSYEKWTSSKNGAPTASNTTNDSLPSGVQNEETQITTYKGFYIARYEAGIPTDDSNLTAGLTTASIDARNKTGKPVSKKNQIPWNYIDYTISKANAESMYTSGHVKSGLVTGSQWDATMKWLEKSSVDVQSNSRSWGNYYDAAVTGITEYSTDCGASWTTVSSTTKGISTQWLLKTGNTDYTSRKDIYDLAGNLWEWTNEIYSSNCVIRGGYHGSYFGGGARYPAASRDSYSINTARYDTGFRCVLYIQ